MHKARKRFGQNFLQDPNIINELLAHLQISEDEHWVEIGPGLGALTQPLLEQNIQLDVIELDWDLVEHLRQQFKPYQNLTIHSADALTFDFAALPINHEPLRIIGNLPYNISTPLIFHLLDASEYIEDMHFMLQKEVVDRICAEPGSKKYGRLSVMTQYFCETEYLFDVPPESFDPIPKVMSAILRLKPFKQPPVQVDDLDNLKTIVTQAFSQRRKTIRNSLKKQLTEEQIKAAGVNPDLRAEAITLEEFAHLSNFLATES